MNKRFKDHKQYRLPYFNYSSTGSYFITVCTKDRVNLFGRIENGKIIVTEMGRIAQDCWEKIPVISSFATLDQYVVMPNHVHGIIKIYNPDEDSFLTTKEFKIRPRSISTVVAGFKSAVTKRCREIDPTIDIWQSRFFDRIIRNDAELNNIRQYIKNNPAQWILEKK
ncbi:MAG: transposase [Bacteroidota bacterium]